jgi:hypothetical protein
VEQVGGKRINGYNPPVIYHPLLNIMYGNLGKSEQ